MLFELKTGLKRLKVYKMKETPVTPVRHRVTVEGNSQTAAGSERKTRTRPGDVRSLSRTMAIQTTRLV